MPETTEDLCLKHYHAVDHDPCPLCHAIWEDDPTSKGGKFMQHDEACAYIAWLFSQDGE
jgi:hypothetical protein